MTIVIDNKHVRNSMVIASLSGMIPILGLLMLAIFLGETFFIIAIAGSFCLALFLVRVIPHGYKRGIKQNIILDKNKVTFNWVDYSQEFNFSSSNEWTFAKVGKYWLFKSNIDRSHKKVAVSAFPHLDEDIERFYG